MKKKEIRTALDALKTIRMPKIEDKALRNGIITDHLQLLREQRKYENDLRDLETAHLGAFEDERADVEDLQRKVQLEGDMKARQDLLREIAKHDRYFAALRDYNKAAGKVADEEVSITGIDQDRFVAEIQKQDFDLGILEALYPMFINKKQ